MKLYFVGAAHEVTGSCTILYACGKKIMIDCGMEQGENVYENVELPVSPNDIDAMLLTHAHIDHSGHIPYVSANGFSAPIYTTSATDRLCRIMLMDSAHIQEFEAEWKNRKNKRSGKEPIEPLYTTQDVQNALKYFTPCEYDESYQIFDGIEIKFIDAGHLLGSASIEIKVTENGITKTILFSGDIGNINRPLIKNPQKPPVEKADYVIIESTYGNRLHGDRPDYVLQLTGIIQSTLDRGGNVVIPSFAVGRTQEILYFLRQIKEQQLVKTHPDFEVYVDSPLAVEATNIFGKNVQQCFDEEAKALVEKGINPIGFPGLKLSITSDDSKAINFDQQPKVILSASGMCEAGRIRHHLKHNLWRPESTIVFVGYQTRGTLGRALLEGAKEVKLFGEVIEVKAEITKIAGISGHADKNGLLKWINSFTEKPPKRVFVVHGEDKVCDEFARTLTDSGYNAVAPYSGTVFDLIQGEFVKEALPVAVKKKAAAKKRSGDMFQRLLTAGQRLISVIRKNEGLSNKDTAKFTDQIQALCDKWDRP